MKIEGINDEKCIKCLECVKDCPANLFIKLPTEIGEKRKMIFQDKYNSCIACGHCISICPTDAIIFTSSEPVDLFDGIENPSSLLDYQDLLKLLRVRRSIRRYKSTPVSKNEISEILNAIRYSPSASNSQSWEFIILTDKEKIEMIKNLVHKMMKKLRLIIRFRNILRFIVPRNIKELLLDPATKDYLDKFLKRTKEGDDLVFYSAPVVIITYAPKYGDMGGADAGIALTYGMLAAQSKNIGTCWIGFAQTAINRYKKKLKLLNIPKNMKVNGVLILGHPAVKYHKLPPRETLKVRWY